MLILQPDNTTYDTNMLPETLDFDLRFCVLDYSNPQDVDFFWLPYFFTEVFPRPSADISIGPYRLQMPLDWSIVIADKNFGHMEIIELKDLRDRPFEAFVFNPIAGYIPEFYEITHLNNFPDVTWNVPKLKFGHILAVPLLTGKNPPCAFFVRDIHRLPDSLDITKILP